jgi:NAD-dependent dihydropyrimidine dehydrogenase PreA subunit
MSAGELHGVFIRVEVEESARADAELARKLEEACPVDIFAGTAGRVEIVDENLDECVLCELCLDAAPPGAVRVVKRYDGDVALER